MEEISSSGFDDASLPRTSPVTFKVQQNVKFGEEILIVGDEQVLGSWSLSKAQKLEWHEGDVWSAQVDLPVGTEIEYKYAVTSHNDDDAKWMPGQNFSVTVPDIPCEVNDVWGEAKKRAMSNGDATTATEAVDFSEDPLALSFVDNADYSKMTVKEIKSILKAKGLPVSGKKAELVARLVETGPEGAQ